MLSCFIDGTAFSITEIATNFGSVDIGSYSTDRRFLAALAWKSTGGGVNITTFQLAGHNASSTIGTTGGGSLTAGVLMGLFDITETGSQTFTLGTLGSNGATIAFRLYKILGYTTTHDTAQSAAGASSSVTTVNDRAAVTGRANAAGTGEITLTSPTDGTSVASGSIGGTDPYTAAISFD